MKQTKIENISHDINVDVILKCLWAIRDNDQFYFKSYGKEMIERCISQQVEKCNNTPDYTKSEIQLTAFIKDSKMEIHNGKSDFVLGWRKCYDWINSLTNPPVIRRVNKRK